MKTVEQLRDEAAQIDEKLGSLRATLTAERRDPTEEERQGMKDAVKRLEQISEDIDLIESMDKASESVSKPKREAIKPEPAAQDPGETRKREPDDRSVIGVSLPNSSKAPWRNFGEFCLAVIEADTGNHVDARLLATRSTGLNELVPSEGGFLVPSDFSTQILNRVYEVGQVMSRVDKISVSGNGLTVNAIDETSRVDGSRWGGIRGYWKAEGTQGTASEPKFRQMDMKLKKLFCMIYLTDELLADATALEGIVRKGLTEEIVFKVEDAIVNGSGAGLPLGIMNSACKVAVTRNTTSHVRFEDVVGMWARAWARGRLRSVWLINQDVEPDLIKMYAPGDATTSVALAPAYLPPGGLSQQPYGTLFGRPVIPVEYCQTLGTTGDIILADLSEYILIDKAGGIDLASSIHLKFDYDEVAFRAIFRCNGQPKWTSALTPFKGSNTLSPFIVTAT